MSDAVWYVAYGSNLLLERFACYILGGKAPGCTRRNRGARDHAPPQAEAAMFVDRPLYFARSASSWQRGGVAFVDPEPGPAAETLARPYLITREQFVDLLRQENDDPEADCDPAAVQAAGGILRVSEGWYGSVLLLGEVDGAPLLTFTDGGGALNADIRAPSKPYLQCMIAGLRETFGLNKQGVRKYLEPLPGIHGTYPGPALNKAFAASDALLDQAE